MNYRWFVLLLLAGHCFAQTGFVGAGVAYNAFSTPQINGWATYARAINPSSSLPICTITSWDVTSQKLKPFIAQTSIRTGVFQTLYKNGRIATGIIGDIGMALASDNVGYSVSTGGIALIEIKNDWKIIVAARPMKTSLSERQYIYEIGFGKTF